MPGPTRIVRRCALALTVLVLVLTGCSVRLDAPPPPIPTPDAHEQLRSELATTTEQLIAAAQAGDTEGAAATEQLALAEASQAHLEALGGLWTPPPRPEDPNPTTPAASAGSQDLMAALTGATEQVREALADPDWDADAATLLASIVLYREGALARLAEATGSPPPAAPEPTDELPAELGAESAPLCRTLDALGYAYEVQAARSSGDQRDQARAAGEANRALAESIAVLAGYDGTNTDPRSVSYAVGQDLEESIAAWQADLMPAWLALIGPAAPADRPVLLARARAAATLAPLPETDVFPGLSTS